MSDYVVQGHRFDIVEGYGCRPAIYTSIPAVFLIWVPPLAFSVVTLVFASMFLDLRVSACADTSSLAIALYAIVRRHANFAKHLASHSGLSTSHYIRLMAMAVIETAFSISATSITLWTATLNTRPWTNWADVHWNFSRIDQYFTAYIPPVMVRYYYAVWWFVPISSYVFFLFFAFGRDATREYGACAQWVQRRALRRRARNSEMQHMSLASSVPTFK